MSTAHIPADVRERITSAAQELYEQTGRESMPTVDAVRRLARVDMNSASAVMREWRRSQTAQAAPVAVAIPEAVAQANSAAVAALWQSAQELANESLRAAQAGWEAERAEADHDRQELADAYERQAAELDGVRSELEQLDRLLHQKTTTHAQELAAIRAELAEAVARAERAETRAQVIEQRAGELEQTNAKQAAHMQALESRADVMRTEATELHAAAARAQESAAEARERAALLTGKLEACEAHSAALLARLDATAQPAETKPATTRAKKVKE